MLIEGSSLVEYAYQHAKYGALKAFNFFKRSELVVKVTESKVLNPVCVLQPYSLNSSDIFRWLNMDMFSFFWISPSLVTINTYKIRPFLEVLIQFLVFECGHLPLLLDQLLESLCHLSLAFPRCSTDAGSQDGHVYLTSRRVNCRLFKGLSVQPAKLFSFTNWSLLTSSLNLCFRSRLQAKRESLYITRVVGKTT